MIVTTSSGFTALAFASYRSASPGSAATRALPFATRSAIAWTAGPPGLGPGSGCVGAITMSAATDGSDGAISTSFASCTSSDTTTALTAASSRMNRVCDAASVG